MRIILTVTGSHYHNRNNKIILLDHHKYKMKIVLKPNINKHNDGYFILYNLIFKHSNDHNDNDNNN